jgi:hypothetical protein
MNYSNMNQRLSNHRSNCLAKGNMSRLSTVAGSNPYRAYHQADTSEKRTRSSLVLTGFSALAGLIHSLGRGVNAVQKKLTAHA